MEKILVTGGNRGIGTKLAGLGHRVVITSRNAGEDPVKERYKEKVK